MISSGISSNYNHVCVAVLQHIFSLELEEYKREHIDFRDITFKDNKHVLDLFLATPIGILSILDEESFFPQVTYYMYNVNIIIYKLVIHIYML